jgi:hypothetical protein
MYEIVNVYIYPLLILILLFICMLQEQKINKIQKDIKMIKENKGVNE